MPTELFGGRLDRPTVLKNTANHPPAPAGVNTAFGRLALSLGDEPSLGAVSWGRPTASLGGLNSSVDQQFRRTRDNVPGRHT